MNPSDIIDQFLSTVLQVAIYTDQELNSATQYWYQLLDQLQLVHIEPSQQIIHIILDMYYSSSNSVEWPSHDDLVHYLTSALFQQQLDVYNRMYDELVPVVHHYLFREGYIPNVNDLGCIFEYLLLHQTYPDLNDIFQTMNRHVHLAIDPEGYHQTYKVQTNTKHLELLQPTVFESTPVETPICGLCQDEIQHQQSIYVLPGCKHMFHATDTECINSTIKTWLQTNNKCPLCKQEVILAP